MPLTGAADPQPTGQQLRHSRAVHTLPAGIILSPTAMPRGRAVVCESLVP